MVALKLRKVGNSTGVAFPKEVMGFLHAEAGDTIHATPAPGGVLLTPYDPAFERQMEVARTVMKKNRNALRELAK